MYVIGADIGTTGTKSMLFDRDGKCAARAYREYPLITVAGGGVEQNARDWWDTLVETVRDVTAGVADKKSIRAISLSTQGGSCVLLGEDGEPLANAHSWMDNRPVSLTDELVGLGEKYFYEATGWRLSGGCMAARAVWFANKTPEFWARKKQYLTTVDYLNLRLTGRAAIDPSNAAMTQLFNIRSMNWDEKILAASGVARSAMPEILQTGEAVGALTPNAAIELGLSEKTLVVSGAHDQYAAATGAGAYEAGDLMLSAGTAWVLLAITKELKYDYENYAGVGNHAVPGAYGTLTSIGTAGVCMEWFRKNFAESTITDGALSKESFEKIDGVSATRIGCNPGLFFYPQFNGRAFPRWTPHSKASFTGLSLEHDGYDAALAIMEGVAFDMAISLEALVEKGFSFKRLMMLGGASKSRLWTDIVRNVTGLPITRFKEANTACLGAAAFAASACGMFASVRDAVNALNKNNTELTEAPSGELRDYYSGKFMLYKKRLPLVEEFYKTNL